MNDTDLFKMVKCEYDIVVDPYYVATDPCRDIPMLCVRIYRGAHAWNLSVSNCHGNTISELCIHDSFTQSWNSYVTAFSIFNSIHEIESPKQLKELGFTNYLYSGWMSLV